MDEKASRAEGRCAARAALPADGRTASVGEVLEERYRVLDQLGRGGTAVVYRVSDLTSGNELALKQLMIEPRHRHRTEIAASFEREYQVLAELSHPRVVQVYDYGMREQVPFYTMELLDGGDISERAPLDWRRAGAIAYDVCSLLALLHSRRLVHRDITPRNVRCTRSGEAKVIDFGAMVPMGPGGMIVGTPAFVAPEAVRGSRLDARTDLFSLGATLYYALTGFAPYRARNFAELEEAWNVRPPPPSTLVSGVPKPLDLLILSAIHVDPAMRPRTAFEVMQRLRALLGDEHAEPLDVSRAYLATPQLVGRDDVLDEISREMTKAFEGSVRTILIEGDAGTGRSRVLDVCALSAKTHGGRVLHGSGQSAASAPFGVARMLAEKLVRTAPEAALRSAEATDTLSVLFEPGDGGAPSDEGPPSPRPRDFRTLVTERARIAAALRRWIVHVSQELPLVLAIDDVHSVDEPSASVLAAIASERAEARVCIVATAESNMKPVDLHSFEVLRRQSRGVTLAPLNHDDTLRLFRSIFGDVPNLTGLSNAIFTVARGNPRASMDLAEHAINQALVRYELGGWTLPERIDQTLLPKTAEEAVERRVRSLTPLARWLAEAQSLASHQGFRRDEYERLRPDVARAEIYRAVMELVSAQILIGDGNVHVLAHRGFAEALERDLDTAERSERHRALMALYEQRWPLCTVRHALLAGLESKALSDLAPIARGLPEATNLHALADLRTSEIAATFAHALEAAERCGRNEREVNDLRRWLASISVHSDDAHYLRVAPAWLARLRLDSGYDDWVALEGVKDPQARLMQAMQQTVERFESLPENRRVYAPQEALQGLAHFVGISLAIGSSRLDLDIIESLPSLLEPFAPLSKLLHAIWRNAIAARETICRARPERAAALWIEVYEQLGAIESEHEAFISVFRRAIAHAIGASQATVGLPAAVRWADLLDDDPIQRVNAWYLRRIVRLIQGDWQTAELFLKRAELASLEARGRQMFSNLTWVELLACAMAQDLTGLKRCADRIQRLAERAPGWIQYSALAEGLMRLACDDHRAAAAVLERLTRAVAPSEDAPYPLSIVWCFAVGGYVEALVGLGNYEKARSVGEVALARCRELEVGSPSHALARALALAEAKSGRFAEAETQLESVIRDQMNLGVRGLHLGATFEARARVAICANDSRAVEEYALLTAREYRYGEGSALGARYERLMSEAREVTQATGLALGDVPTTVDSSPRARSAAVAETVATAMLGAITSTERARRALKLLCDVRGAKAGHLFVRQGDENRCVASLHAAVPPTDVAEYAQRYLARLTVDLDGATGLLTRSTPAQEDAHFTDASGTRYYPILIDVILSEGTSGATVALVAGESPERTEREIAGALGGYLHPH